MVTAKGGVALTHHLDCEPTRESDRSYTSRTGLKNEFLVGVAFCQGLSSFGVIEGFDIFLRCDVYASAPTTNSMFFFENDNFG